MKKSKLRYFTLLTFISLIFAAACDDDFSTIGTTVIGESNFLTESTVFDVYVTQRNVNNIQTNGLPLYQLGRFDDPLFSETTASIAVQPSLPSANLFFGSLTAQTEILTDTTAPLDTIPENETITKAYLYIPFFLDGDSDADNDGVIDSLDADPNDPASDTDGDGVNDNTERLNGTNPLSQDTDGDGVTDDLDTDTAANVFPQTFKIDSIYGDRTPSVELKVDELAVFLRDLDPSNFIDPQLYYSNSTEINTTGATLFDGTFDISDQEILEFDNLDNECTEDTDESISPSVRLNPGIRVELDPMFFQENILDLEGEEELVSNTNFRSLFKGLLISANVSRELYLLLNMGAAQIQLQYEYDCSIDPGRRDSTIECTPTDNTDDILVKCTSSVNFPLNGITVNLIDTPTNYPSGITTSDADGLATPEPELINKIPIKGAVGSIAKLRIPDEVINTIKASDWLINEASLTFYVDRNSLDAAGASREPERLYLYNFETGLFIQDYVTDLQIPDNTSTPLPVYGGFLEKTDAGLGELYTLRITDHLDNIILRDSTNVALGFGVTADVNRIDTGQADIDGEFNPDDMTDPNLATPLPSFLTPLSTILVGNDPDAGDEGKKLQLKITYSIPNQ